MFEGDTEVGDLLEDLEDTHIEDQKEFVLHVPRSFTANPLLTDNFASTRFAIFNPAVNSSGDVYHIAAYLILCREFNWTIPKVYIGADTEDTKRQAGRALKFLELLGFGGHCEILECDKPGRCEASPRALQIRKKLISKRTDAIDQKMTTALLSYASLKLGSRIPPIMKYGFLNFPWLEISRKHSDLIHAWLNQKIKQIITAVGQSPFVVIHHRFSGKTNSGQSLSNETCNAIINFLSERGIKYFCLRISDKKQKAHKNFIDVFEAVTALPSKYDKFRHVQLLQAIASMRNFFGIIGGTSGTLDVAAFIGIRVFNIHDFKDASKSPDQLIPYQDYRILLQVQFMTVCRAFLTNKAGKITGQIAIFLSHWLGNITHFRIPLFIKGRARYIDGDSDEHNDRVSFKHCVLWDENGNEVGRTLIKRPSGNLYVAPANRFFKQQKDWLQRSLEMSSVHSKAVMFAGGLLAPNKLYSKDDIDLTSMKPPSILTCESPF